MMRISLVLLLNFFNNLDVSSAATSSACSICFCSGNEIFCQEKRLPAIPNDLPATITNLNLKGNQFEVRTLYRSNFTKFRNLNVLSLSKCGLELINADAFADLTALTQLDLSSNRLLIIEDGTFAGLNLQNLFLHYNLGLFLSERAFINASIRHLSMRHCGLYNLEPAVLAPLSDSLEDLLLDKNKLTTLDEEIFAPGFPRLKSLSLGGNPWHCSCEIRWLKTFHARNRSMFIQEDLACQTPELVSNFYFASLHLADFECQPPIFEDISIVFHAERAELSCTVGSEASTSISWLTPSGTRHVYQSGAPQFGQDGSAVDRHRITTAKLVVPRPPYVQPSVEGELASSLAKQRQTFRCVAGNLMGNVSASVDVVWPPPVRIHQAASAQKSQNGPSPGANNTDLLMLGSNPAICVDTMAIIGAIVGTFAVTLVSILITLLATRKIRACIRRRQAENGFLHRRSGHRDAPCWGPVISAGKLVGNGGSLRPGSAGGNGCGAATPLVLNTSSGSSSSSSRQSASGGNISNGNGTLNGHVSGGSGGSGAFVYHPAHTFHHGGMGMLSAANNLEELSHFIDTASSPSSGGGSSGPPLILAPAHPSSSASSGGFTYHAPAHKQMQVSLNSQQLHRTNLR